MNPTTAPDRVEQVVTHMTDQLATLLRPLCQAVLAQSTTLTDLEQHVLPVVHALGASILTDLCHLTATEPPLPTSPCACGQPARYLRQRPAQVRTLLGPITVVRPYYHCATCCHGHAPRDTQLQLCAGSRSAGLDDLLALLGATQDSFAQAAAVLARLTLVQVSPNTVREATERLGAALNAHTIHATARTLEHADIPPAAAAPHRLYIAMDGVFAHLHDRGWSEIKVGCCFETIPHRPAARPTVVEIRTVRPSYLAALTEAAPFGDRLWAEAARRGVLDAAEVIVVSDGAHWIWNVAATHFPGATQIVDWFHASAYLAPAATAIWGDGNPERTAWIAEHKAALWDGKVAEVLVALAAHAPMGAGVTDAHSYYTTHQERMEYAAYRARGLQIGSGSVESACKQLVTARLKQAGMIWRADGAAAVATVRAWLKSDRWAEAMALRPPRQRTYMRRTGAADAVVEPPPDPPPPAGRPGGLPAAVLAQVQAELAQERAIHPWRQGWRGRQTHHDHAGCPESPLVITA